MQEITRLEKDWLISKGYLKPRNGKYYGLGITSKHKKGKRKRYYVLDSLADKAKLMVVKDNQMVDIKELK